MKIIFKSRRHRPLLDTLPGRVLPLGAFVEVDLEDETIDADIDYNNGSEPMNVFLGHAIRYPIDGRLPLQDVRSLLEEILPLAERMENGYSSEWDGRNEVGVLDRDAEAANLKILRLCEQYSYDCRQMMAVSLAKKPGRKPGVKSVSEKEEKIARSVTLPRELWEKLDQMALDDKITRAELFRRIIRKYLEET